MTSRHFLNTPMLRDFADVEAFANALGALAIAGYTGPDGSHRAMLEITADAAAEEIDRRSRDVEAQAAQLSETAERMRP